MFRFLRIIILVLLALILLGFAFANHHDVIVSFDPFATIDNAAYSRTAPLFVVVVVAAMLGVVAGALATWVSQGRHRRASRQNRAEAEKWRAQAQALRSAHPALTSDR